MDILKGLSIGSIICINDSLLRVAKNIQLFEPNMILMVPLMIETLAKKLEDAAKLRHFLVKKESVRKAVSHDLQRRRLFEPGVVDVFERYGLRSYRDTV